MGQGASLELDPGLIEGDRHDDGRSTLADHLIALSSWMVVLGAIRFLFTLTDFAGSFIEAWRFSPMTTRAVGWWLTDNRVILILCASWPLVLSLCIRRARWPELLPAAAATFLVLSVGGLLAVVLDWSHAQGRGGTVGSFHLTRRAFLHPRFSDIVFAGLGFVQLILELVVAVRIIQLIPRFRSENGGGESSKRERDRQARSGRLAVYASLGFLVLMIRMPAWSTYLELLNNSTLVRNFVLRSEFTQLERPRGLYNKTELTDDEKWVRKTQDLLRAAAAETNENEFRSARESYLNIVARIDELPEGTLRSGAQSTLALALNNLAWLQATSPDPTVLSSGDAVRQARRAVELLPKEGNYWNTLGVAYYRAGEWTRSKDALSRSMALRAQGDGTDWFFLALVELKLGNKDEAMALYNKAVEWYHQYHPDDRELYRFHVEAAQELALAKPSPPSIRSERPAPIISPPLSFRRRLRLNASDVARPAPH
jgi:tetratricopeptide (TPR) repeat protein